MIIKYANFVKTSSQASHLIKGKKYFVLKISFNSKNIKYCVRSKNPDYDPIPVESECFEVIDPHLPEGWVVNHHENGHISMQPAEFAGDFWEQYYEGDEAQGLKTAYLFEETYQKIRKFHYPHEDSSTDVVKKILKASPELRGRFYELLDDLTQGNVEKASVSKKLESLSECLCEKILDKTLLPQTVVNVMELMEDYILFLEDGYETARAQNGFFEGLLKLFTSKAHQDQVYEYARLFKNNLGPACEELCMDNELWNKFLEKK